MRGYLLSYDIGNPKRLRAMRKLACAYGRPLQFSVFWCILRREDRVRLGARINGLVSRKEDRVVIVDLGAVKDRESWIAPMEIFGNQHAAVSTSIAIV